MAKRASIATGNWLTAGTWGLVDATLFANSETSGLTCPTAYSNVARSAQATPGAIVVSHIGVKLQVRTGTTGTMTVHIADSSHVEIGGTAVTINTADLPVAASADQNGGWHFFKLSSPVTLSAATLYEVEAKTSSSSQINVYGSAATNGMSCALITTTTGAPAAGDDMFINGEYTGAGTSNSFTVTMDETATTDYGAAPTAATSIVQPGVAISNKGTLSYGATAATNYYLKMSNSIVVYSGGTFNMGTTGTPIPRDSTAKLNFDPGTAVDYGLIIRNLGTFVAQGLSRTAGNNTVSCKLNTDEAIASTSLGVDTDTGWLDNDQIAVASTSRTYTDSESGLLNGAAGASTLIVDGFAGAGGGLAVAHSGTSPTQAEVINVTRNVSIFGASASLPWYSTIAATATVDIDWTELYWMGFNAANKQGIQVNTTTGSFSMQYSSMRDCAQAAAIGIIVQGSASNNYEYSNNVSWNIGRNHINTVPTTGTSWTISNNVFIYTSENASQPILAIGDVQGTFTNNTMVSSRFQGITYGKSSNSNLGTFSGNTAHSNGSSGFVFQDRWYPTTRASLSTITSWRNTSVGIQVTTNMSNVTFLNATLFGNTTHNILMFGGTNLIFDTLVASADTTFATTNGVSFSVGTVSLSVLSDIYFLNSTFGVASGIKVAHTNDFNLGAAATNAYLKNVGCINCLLASTTEVTGQSSMPIGSAFFSQKHDQTAGNHKTYKQNGTISIETGTVHTGSQSMSMTPNSAATATNKFESSSGINGGFKIAVANGATVTPTVWINKSAAYDGNQPRLVVKRNDAIGISADAVLATYSAGTGSWNSISGATAAATDDGVMEFVVDCDYGTGGIIYVDSFSVA